MIALLIVVPWLLTTAALLTIMFLKKRPHEHEEDEFDEDFFGEEETVRVAVYGERAYWVYDNVFYESDVMREPDFTTARPIDTMSMSPKDLHKLMNILDEHIEETERD